MMHAETHFVDILEPRRTQSGIFRFMTRDWHPKKAHMLPKKYSPQNLKDLTASSLYLENVLEAESARTGVSKEKLKQEILEYVEEIGLDKKMYVIRWLGMFALKVAFNMNVGIYVNELALLKIKSSMGKNPVLFLPTHRSYADFCILTYLCYHYDIELPAVASGMDFYSMAVIGRALRDTCAFYMRRTLAGAPLYAATLRQYVRTLVSRHDAPLEFFLEGTRSRSNKPLPPKYGMLSMALGPLFAGEVPDVTVVPVHIAYDRLMEQTTFAYQHLGVPKPKESTRGLLKWVSSLNDQFGNMYINFGAPLSAKEMLRLNRGTRTTESLQPADLQELTPEQFAQVRSVAHTVMHQQQTAALLTYSQLLALALTRCFIVHSAVTRDCLLEDLRCYHKVLSALGACIWKGRSEEEEIDRALVVHGPSWARDQNHRLRVLLPAPSALAPHQRYVHDEVLSADRLRSTLPLIQLQLYVNPALHYLVPPSLVTLLAALQPTPDEMGRHYRLLRKMLRYEFFYAEEHESQCYSRALQYCLEQSVVRLQGEKFVTGDTDRCGRGVLTWCCWGALCSLQAAAITMKQQISCEHAVAVKLIQREVASSLSSPNSSICRPPYSLSLDAAANCLRGLAAVEAVSTTKTNETTTYHLVPDVMQQCQTLVESIMPRYTVDFSSNNPVFMERPAKSRL